MITKYCFLRSAIVGIFILLVPVAAGAEASGPEAAHPLEIHMKHWISGSGEWRAPNPDYDPAAEPRTSGWIKYYGINWKWGPFKQHLVGEIIGIAIDGEVVKFWQMYTFYNPATERVISQQVGRNGAFSFSEDRVLSEPTPYDEPAILDAIGYNPDGTIKIARHSNVFSDENTHLADVYERNDVGEWERMRQWKWIQVQAD